MEAQTQREEIFFSINTKSELKLLRTIDSLNWKDTKDRARLVVMSLEPATKIGMALTAGHFRPKMVWYDHGCNTKLKC